MWGGVANGAPLLRIERLRPRPLATREARRIPKAVGRSRPSPPEYVQGAPKPGQKNTKIREPGKFAARDISPGQENEAIRRSGKTGWDLLLSSYLPELPRGPLASFCPAHRSCSPLRGPAARAPRGLQFLGPAHRPSSCGERRPSLLERARRAPRLRARWSALVDDVERRHVEVANHDSAHVHGRPAQWGELGRTV